MRTFVCRHEIVVNAEGFWKHIHESTEFLEALYHKHLEFEYEVLENDPSKGIRKTYITPKVDAPKAIVKVMGDSISFSEHGQLAEVGAPAETRRYNFRVIPNKFADRINITGHMATETIDDTRCYRVVEFNIDCNIFGIGGILERFVQKEVERSYSQSAEITNTYLRDIGVAK